MSFQDLEAGRQFNSRRGAYANGVRKQDPTQAIASGIFQINTAVSSFQRLVNTLGTPKDTPELREKLYVLFYNFSSIIVFLGLSIAIWSKTLSFFFCIIVLSHRQLGLNWYNLFIHWMSNQRIIGAVDIQLNCKSSLQIMRNMFIEHKE